MPRNVPPLLLADLKNSARTMCYVLKVMPKSAPVFGLCSTNIDVLYDDGKGSGSITYRARRGYTPTDITTRADLTVDNGEAHGLLAMYPLDGVTLEGIARGDYDGATFAQYLINYEAPSHGHVQVNGGTIGQIRNIDDLAIEIELRSLTQTLKQNSVIELTSITCRAKFGDERCKMPFVWKSAIVTDIGAEPDRQFGIAWADDIAGAPAAYMVPESSDDGRQRFQLMSGPDSSAEEVTAGYVLTEVTMDGVAREDYLDEGTGVISFDDPATSSEPVVQWSGWYASSTAQYPAGFLVPGIAQWKTGSNVYQENEIEDIDSNGVTLVIPTRLDIQVNDVLRIRRDCNKSKAMCKDYGNILNMRGEPELPRADGSDLQAPTPKQG